MTIIVLLILAGVSISMLTGENGILKRAREAKEETETSNKDEQRRLAQSEALMSTGKTTYKGITIPNGFAPTKIEGEDSLNEGLVMTDGYGNEYIWIEVPKTTEIYQTAGINITEFTDEEYNKIEANLHTYTRNETDFRDVWYDAKNDSNEANQSNWYQSESDYNTAKQKMLKSVYQNGGFWIGRYEAGIEANRTSSGIATAIPLSKANLYPYTYVTRTQAKTLAEQVESGSYTSSLMFGVQWDLVLRFIEEKTVATSKEDNKENVRTKIVKDLNEDSTNIGNYNNNLWKITNKNAKYSINYGASFNSCQNSYSKDYVKDIVLTTGADESFSLVNIYDIAGNVSEWTLENTLNNDSPCAGRGGNYGDSGTSIRACSRFYEKTSYSNINVGFRIAIY